MADNIIEISGEVEDSNFPEESGQIISQLLEKYGLQKAQEEGINKFIKLMELKTITGRDEIFDNLPGTKISKLIREYVGGKIALEKLPQLLKINLGIPEKEAQKLANDLKDKILDQIKLLSPTSAPSLEEKERSQKSDTYREQI